VGHGGALYPWRTINGDESSAAYQAGTAQYHLNADIAYAIRRYIDVRGDVGLLVEMGAEILVETARMWEDLGFYGEDGCFHLHGVTGPDEYTALVNDNAFTNLMARLNLNYAAIAVRRLKADYPEAHAALCFELGLHSGEVDAWERAASAMYVPYDETTGITPQDDSFLKRGVWVPEARPPDRSPLLLHFHPLVIYRHQVLKQADVVMACSRSLQLRPGSPAARLKLPVLFMCPAPMECYSLMTTIPMKSSLCGSEKIGNRPDGSPRSSSPPASSILKASRLMRLISMLSARSRSQREAT